MSQHSPIPIELLPFGDTGLRVSRLGFGAGHIGAAEQTDAQVAALLDAVLASGCNLIDTARGYGESEARIGRLLRGRRDEFVLSSKCGYGVSGVQDWTAEAVHRGVDLALQTLQTDRIDILHLHSCPRETLEHGGVVAALVDAKNAGKIRCAAYSGENDALAWALASGAFDSVQLSVNLCDQRSLAAALPDAAQRGLGVIAKRPLCNAFWRFKQRPSGDYAEEYWLRAQAMALQPPEGMAWGEFALRFAAFAPNVHAAIVGTSKVENWRACAEWIAKGPLDDATITATRARFQQHDQGWEGQI